MTTIGPDPGTSAQPERGMSLVEVAFGAFLTLVILMTLLSVNDAAQKLSRDQAEALQVDSNLRAGMELIARDMEQAGLGMLQTGQVKRLGATIFPNRSAVFTCCTAATGWTDSEISFLINPEVAGVTATKRIGPWAQVQSNMLNPGDPIAVEPSWNAAEFVVGDRAFIVGPNAASAGQTVGEWFTVGAVSAAGVTLTPATALTAAYQASSIIMKPTMLSYYLDDDPDRAGLKWLMRREGTDFADPDSTHMATTFPVAENVKALKFQYFGKALTPNELSSAIVPGPAVTVNNGRIELRKVRVSLTAETDIVSRTKRTSKLLARTFVSEISPRNQIARGNN